MQEEIFNTNRLSVRQFNELDKDYFIELLSDPDIINPIPQEVFKMDDILSKFKSFSKYDTKTVDSEKSIWGVYEINQSELIGLCGLLTNDENERELAYRFRKKYWGKGYWTEITKGLIDYSFNVLEMVKISADVNIENIGSVKILEKFLTPIKEFYNEKDKCTDRRYKLEK